jgi:Rrf2 family protein
MSVLSKSCIYGVQAAIYIASRQSNDYVSIQEIAGKLSISFHFLTKVLQILTQAGIMVSYRGPNGGVALARPASSVTLADIIGAIDGTEIFTECFLGLPGCGHATPCPVHDQWSVVRKKLHQTFEATTLAELAMKASNLNARLSLSFLMGAENGIGTKKPRSAAQKTL